MFDSGEEKIESITFANYYGYILFWIKVSYVLQWSFVASLMLSVTFANQLKVMESEVSSGTLWLQLNVCVNAV